METAKDEPFDLVKISKPVLRDTRELTHYENNAKEHTREQIAAIAKSIEEFGWEANPIEITRDNVIVNGHGRLFAAVSLGIEKVPCVVLNGLEPDQIRAYRLAHNKVAEGKYDTQKLADEIAYLVNDSNLEINLRELNFNERDLEVALDDLGEMNLDVLANDIDKQLEQASSETNQFVDEEEKEMVALRDVFAFREVNLKQQRMIKRLVVYAEDTTGATGAEALSQLSQDLTEEKFGA